MTTAFRSAMEISTPRVRVGSRGFLKLPPNILRFIAEKKRLRRLVRRCEDPGRHSILKADIRNLDRIIQGAISAFERDHWKNFLGNIKLNDKTYRKVRAATGLNRNAGVQDLLDTEGLLVADDDGKANLLAEHFCCVHRGGQEFNANSFADTVRNSVSTLRDNVPLVTFDGRIRADGTMPNGHSFVREEMIRDALKKRPNKRSSGADGIPDIVLKRAPNEIWKFLAILFNHCLNIGYFPKAWKKALVVPILKPRSDPGLSGNYRPISLLSPFGKLLEHIILSRIKDKISNGNILVDSQFGFRSGHSTSHALAVFSDFVSKGLNRRHPTIAVSLDIAKAFDTAWQNGIIFKMVNMGFDRNICRIVANFLDDRTFKVRVGESRSSERTITSGVPQGSLLGPVLYNIFVSDIPSPPGDNLLLMYADDILVAFAGPRAETLNSRVNGYLATLGSYLAKWQLSLNFSKSVAVMIKGRRKYLYPNSRSYIPCLKIGDNIIPTADRMKYLGVIFHENFEFYRHIDYVLERTKCTYAVYRRILGRQGGLDRRIGLLLYRQVIRPLMSYAFPVWSRISSAQMERLRIWERRILVACLGLRPRLGPDGIYRRPSCRSIYAAIDFDRIDSFMIKMGIKFLEGARAVENRLLEECFERAGNLETVHMSRYLSPLDFLTLNEAGLLYDDGKLLFYHRRINTLDTYNVVYNTAQ